MLFRSTIININGPTVFCEGNSITLEASSGQNYFWNNGSTQQSITVTEGGSYNVVVSSNANCTALSQTIDVIVNNAPSSQIVSDGPLAFCPGEDVLLTADSIATNYLWSNGTTNQSLLVTTAGSYYLTMTNAFGCVTHSDTVTVTISANPVANIYSSGNLNLCTGDSVILSADPGAVYLWSNGITTQSITVFSSGSYYVSVNNGQSCIGYSDTMVVTQSQSPQPQISLQIGRAHV